MTKGWRDSLLWRVGGNLVGLHTVVASRATWESSTPRHPAYHKKQKTTDSFVGRFQRSEAIRSEGPARTRGDTSSAQRYRASNQLVLSPQPCFQGEQCAKTRGGATACCGAWEATSGACTRWLRRPRQGSHGSAPPSIPQKKQKTTDKTVSRFLRSEADSNRCSSFCRAVPSHSAIRPYYPFGSANIQTFSFFTKFLPFFHRKVKISTLSHTKTSYREIISQHKHTHTTPYIGFLKKKRNFTLRKKAKRCTSKILR